MSNKILVTDSLFIFSEHEQKLKDAGYDVVRLDKPNATEDELCEAIKGKVGYILGGTEKVTDAVIESADELKAIAFTGIGYKSFIPGYDTAIKKGIAISNVPDGPTQPVAEWALSAALFMNRGFSDLQNTTFMTTRGLQDQTIGIIGLGRIGKRIATMLQPFQPAKILYNSLHQHASDEQPLNLQFSEVTPLLKASDIVFLCVSDEAGKDFFTADHFANMKHDALLVSFMHPGVINADALFDALSSNAIRAISDYPMNDRFNSLSASRWYSFKASNAFNTAPSLAFTSNEATAALINLLTTGKDENRVV